jgi:transcriptional antiterminator NusG
VPEYDDETAPTADEQSTVATADDAESVEAASAEPVAEAEAPEADENYDPVAELRQKLRYAPGDWYVVQCFA